MLDSEDLYKKLGTNFYNIALYTKGGILLHPGKLVRSMINALPENVYLYENSLSCSRLCSNSSMFWFIDSLSSFLSNKDMKSILKK